VLIARWNRLFFDALQEKNYAAFVSLLGRFGVLALTLGGLTQTALAFGQVQSSLSWFVDAYPRIAQWTASVNRLTGFDDSPTTNTASRDSLDRGRRGVTCPLTVRSVDKIARKTMGISALIA